MLGPGFLVFVGAAVAAAAVPLATGKVPPNSRYGFRTPATLADPRLWYLVNRASGRYFIGSGLMMATLAVAMLIGVTPSATHWFLLGILPPVLFAAVGSGIALDRAMARREHER